MIFLFGWQQFEQDQLVKMRKFRSHLNTSHVHKLFYPFAGADIIFPLTFFPNADVIVMVGLSVLVKIKFRRNIVRAL